MNRTIINIIMCFLVFQQARAGDFADFIVRINAVPLTERPALVDSFMQKAGETGFPFLEDTQAHFIYRGNVASTITIAGDFNDWDAAADTLHVIPGTDFYYLSKTFEYDARLDYKYVLNNSSWILDPLNHAQVSGGFGANSELAMLNYIQPPEIKYYKDIPHGKFEVFDFSSEILHNQRKINVYLPPDYDAQSAPTYPTIYVNDGSEYKNLASIKNIVDYLINLGDIPPLILVLVDPVDRNSEYSFNEAYKNMLITELVPYIDGKYPTKNHPQQRGIMGPSLGGLVSAYISWYHPDVFGFCASQSGSFWLENEQMTSIIEQGPERDIRYYLDWGTYEPTIQQSGENLSDLLLAWEYPLITNAWHEGHSWGNWRAHIDDILRAFVSLSADIKDYPEETMPLHYNMLQNYPNPFNSSTTIVYSMSTPGAVQIEIVDELGRHIITLENMEKQPGEYFLHWDGRDQQQTLTGSGVYFCLYKLNGELISTRQMLMVK